MYDDIVETTLCYSLGRRFYNRRAVLTARRQRNLAKAFNQVVWHFDKATLHNFGRIGDRTQWNIPGHLGKLVLNYKHQSPGGGQSSLRVFDPTSRKITYIRPAQLKHATRIQLRLRKLAGAEVRVTTTRKRREVVCPE